MLIPLGLMMSLSLCDFLCMFIKIGSYGNLTHEVSTWFLDANVSTYCI